MRGSVQEGRQRNRLGLHFDDAGPGEVKAAVENGLPDIGKEGSTPFAFVFEGVPRKLVASGAYDYAVEVLR